MHSHAAIFAADYSAWVWPDQSVLPVIAGPDALTHSDLPHCRTVSALMATPCNGILRTAQCHAQCQQELQRLLLRWQRPSVGW